MKEYLNSFKKYSNLLKELVKKGIVLKYRRSYLGILWTLLEPILTTIVLTIVFSNLYDSKNVERVVAGHKIGVEFAVYVLTGRLIYSFFSQATKQALRSIRSNAGMIKKVYVPKYLYPLSSILYTFIIFLISLLVLVGAMLVFKVDISWHVIEGVIPIVLLLMLSFGVGLILATGAVFFRDLEYLWEVALMMIMYASAIFYDPVKKLAEAGKKPGLMAFKIIIEWNPVYLIINLFRNAVIFKTPMDMGDLFTVSLVTLITMVVGVFVFYKNQDKFILHI